MKKCELQKIFKDEFTFSKDKKSGGIVENFEVKAKRFETETSNVKIESKDLFF